MGCISRVRETLEALRLDHLDVYNVDFGFCKYSLSVSQSSNSSPNIFSRVVV